jgi:polar amino acid transport system substrate-binding protein
MIDDGTYLKLYRKYFDDPIATALIKAHQSLARQVRRTDPAPTSP